MASTYTDIGTELMTTGENASTWGTKTNTNLKILEEAIRGYVSQSIAGSAQTTALTYTDGTTGDSARQAVVELSGTITGNQVVTVTAKEKWWIIKNSTSGAYTVQVMVSGQTGVTWATTDKGAKILYCNGTDVVDTDISSNELTSGTGDITLDSAADIVIDAAGGNVEFKDAGTTQLTLDMDTTASVQILKLGVNSDDLVFQQYDGNEVVRIADDRRLYFYDKGGEYIYGDGTDLHIVSGADVNLSANIGLTFGDDGEKIEGDGTDLTITGNTINLTATTDVALAVNTGILFAGTEKIESDGTDLSITVGASGDINIPADIGLTFGDDGEKIEGDGTDLTIISSGVLNLAAGGTTNQIKVTDGAILPITDDDVDLGSSSYQFKDVYVDGTLEADAITIGGSAVVSSPITAVNNATANELVTIGGTTTELEAEANLTFTGSALTCIGTVTVGVDNTGHDVKYFGATSGSYWLWDESADGVVQIGTLTVGVDDAGHDVKFFGDAASAFMLWDASTDDLVLGGAAKLYLYDAAGGENISSDGSTLSIAGGGEIDLTATAIDINGTCDVSGTLTNASTAVKVAGTETIWVPANAMTATTSNGCAAIAAVETTSGRPDMYVLDFDKDSDEHAQFTVAFPKSWNAGTITFQAFWSGLAATGGVSWGLQGVAFADNDSIDTAYGTAVVVDDTEQGAVEEVNVSAASGAVTIAGSPGDDELCYFRIFRDVSDSNDDSGGDARLHGIKLYFTTDAKNDA